ncbi:MAG: hypothetical protein JNL28_08490 [Planctomycetes bacterium]|nr:hypothetical protein [Planctomycetota bacterium]
MKHLDRAPVRAFATSLVLAGAAALVAFAAPQGSLPLPTTLEDFKQPGTQPLTITQPIIESSGCTGCHSGYDPNQEPHTRWVTSMMGQAGRDPVFYAALTIANQDAADSGEYCLRCHAPGAWLDGRSVPADGSALVPALGDLDGVTCHLCHRMVDPIYEAGVNPPSDVAILAALTQIPPTQNNGQFIIDPDDFRRGPFDLGPSFVFHAWEQSPHHRESAICGTCHDVSNQTTQKQPDLSYKVDAVNTQHATHNKRDQFPIERTYSEWTASQYARGPIDTVDALYPSGRFGGNAPSVSSCQDCHMPKTTGTACQPVLGGAIRPDLPLHDFNGVNSWVLDAVRSLYPDSQTGLTAASVAAANARTAESHQRASDLHAWVTGGQLGVRIVNQTGHKLPTGYNEGRRMWINVRFFGPGNVLIAERGAYDSLTATLTTSDTKVYEGKYGLDAQQAALTGLPAGESFHFVLNNTVVFDNRIPPRGFTNYNFGRVQASPVGVAYAEEQYWDDTFFNIPLGAVSATVTTYHQTSTREYMEFLRDANTTDNRGLIAYNAWVAMGKSTPSLKRTTTISLVGGPCVEPIPYGVSKTLSASGKPVLGWTGVPSATINNFQIRISAAQPDATGILFSSPTSASVAFNGGTLYLGGALTRVANFQLDLSGARSIAIPVLPGMVGTNINYQAMFRDPGASFGYGITHALHVRFCD